MEKPEIGEILFDRETIGRKVAELADRIAQDYAGKELVLVCILKGAVAFTADLMRLIPFPVALDFVQVSSYGMGTETSRKICIKKDIETDLSGKHVLLVDCVIDSGETMTCLLKRYGERNAASLKAAVLLDKPSRRTVAVPLAYRGFEIPDTFVVGYGVDCAEQYRNLPYIAALKDSA